MADLDSVQHRSPNRTHDRRFFYKYMSARVAKIVLNGRKLRWSSPLVFNDPFDVTQELRLHFDPTELAPKISETVADMIERGDARQVQNPTLNAVVQLLSGRPLPERQAMARGIRAGDVSTPGQLASFNMLRTMWQEMVPTFRVLCVSELNDVTPMWHHYADAYKGVVLEFEALDEVDSPFLVARPVRYQDEAPRIASVETWVAATLFGEPSHLELFQELECVKTTAWMYEKEWRVVSVARPGESGLTSDWGFNSLELRGIYFGPRCVEQDKVELEGMLSGGFKHVRTWQASESKMEAKFEFELRQDSD